MIYLLLQITFASAFTLIIKWAQIRQREDVITIGAINYIVAALAIAPEYVSNGDIHSATRAATAAWSTGGAMGAIYFIAFFFVIYSIRVVGASATTVVSVLSIIFPIAAAALIWDEVPNPRQIIGIAMALVALSLIGLKDTSSVSEKKVAPWLTPTVLLAFFLLCGCNRLAQETFKHASVPEQRSGFVLAAFMVAAIPSFFVLCYRRRAISRTELGFGIMMGMANMLQTHLILNCLEHFPGYVVFTVTSAGAIIMTTLVATGLLHERLSGRTQVGISLAVVALAMLQWNV